MNTGLASNPGYTYAFTREAMFSKLFKQECVRLFTTQFITKKDLRVLVGENLEWSDNSFNQFLFVEDICSHYEIEGSVPIQNTPTLHILSKIVWHNLETNV